MGEDCTEESSARELREEYDREQADRQAWYALAWSWTCPPPEPDLT